MDAEIELGKEPAGDGKGALTLLWPMYAPGEG